MLAPFIAAFKKARNLPTDSESVPQPSSQMKKKALFRREQDSRYGWLPIDTADFKVDQKISKQIAAYPYYRNAQAKVD